MPRPRSLRFHLLRLVLAGLIPTSVFAGVLLVLLWWQQQGELSKSLQDTTRALSLAVDRELETSIKRLEVISNEESFRAGRWEEFHDQSYRLLVASEDWVNLLVFTAEGDELVNVRTPFQGPLPQFDSVAYVRRVAREGRPVVSDLFESPTTGHQVVHVAVPVPRIDGPTLVLAASLNLSGFDRLLVDQATGKEGIASIYDRQLRFVARSRDSKSYLGKHPNSTFLEALARVNSGSGRYPVYDSPDVYSAWTRSELTGWAVSVGVPAAPAEASLQRSLMMLAGAGLAVLLVTGLVALHLGRGLAGTVAKASAGATALAKGEPLPELNSNVTELNVLAAALARTGEALKTESDERARAERERQALFEREQQARHEAEEAGRAKDEFLAMLGHELRNPLAPILFAVELAKTHPHEPPTRELQVIERQAKHIVQLVDDLLDVARIVRGKISLNKQVGEIQPIISKAVEIAAPLLETKQHQLVLEVPKQGLRVEADETRLAQVVANLLTNAAKFTDAGGRITLTGAREGDEVVVRVRDSGVGIPPELLPKVFDLFTQGKRSNHVHAGLGLGLALVRSFVQLHGGTVTADSDGLGHGSVFTVRLPAADAHERLAASAHDRTAPASAGPSARILVVDDNVDAAVTLGELLAAQGHEVRTAHDGREALVVAGEFHPQIAIVDIGMPVMDGYQVAQALSSADEPPYLIAVTGYGQEHDRTRSRAAGFDRHLVKPVAADQLSAYLDEALKAQ